MPTTKRLGKPFHGFTLIELLISIAVISLLTSLLLPALHETTGAARSTHCKNNLRQIGVALRGYAEVHSGYMPFHVGEGDMTEKSQSAMFALLPYCEENPLLYRCPDDIGSKESSIPFWDTFGSSYKLEGRALSQHAFPERTVREYNPKKGAWENKRKKATPLVVRQWIQHDQGVDVKKIIEGKAQEDQPNGSSQIQLARDFLEPWKLGEVKWNQLRGVYTMHGYHAPTHMNVVFVDGHVESFGDKSAWDLSRGKRIGGSDD
jgi:prepilin-type N-terminal cleavage/methylation domain-containing protein/prepilin-type processing-associated H-X9-DG protein